MSSNQQSSGSNTPTISGAITFPSSSNQNVEPTPVQPRQPRNLQGLLRFAMEATKAEDAPNPSEFAAMDEDRRRFLEAALKSLTVSVSHIILTAVKVLANEEKIKSIKIADTVPEDVTQAFESLLECIDDIDIANDFYKLGGFSIFPLCFSCENEDVRANASWVLAELCQNNPFCQARALEAGLLQTLLNLLEFEQGTPLAKCIYAVSCACREFEPACQKLIEKDGCRTLSQLLSASPQARTKAAFFISYLCQHHPQAKENFIELNLVRAVTEQIQTGRDETTEHLLGIISVLIEDGDCRVLDQCRNPAIGLKKVLEATSESEDEKEICQDLLKRIFENCPDYEVLTDQIADR